MSSLKKSNTPIIETTKHIFNNRVLLKIDNFSELDEDIKSDMEFKEFTEFEYSVDVVDIAKTFELNKKMYNLLLDTIKELDYKVVKNYIHKYNFKNLEGKQCTVYVYFYIQVFENNATAIIEFESRDDYHNFVLPDWLTH